LVSESSHRQSIASLHSPVYVFHALPYAKRTWGVNALCTVACSLTRWRLTFPIVLVRAWIRSTDLSYQQVYVASIQFYLLISVNGSLPFLLLIISLF
jgi:hypothetical protein